MCRYSASVMETLSVCLIIVALALLGGVSCDVNKIKEIALQPKNACTLPKDSGSGSCYENKELYFYNSKLCRCESFVYSGCGGNSNKFASMTSCLKSCNTFRMSCQICNEPKKPGPCKAAKPRYFYNKVTCMCEQFSWGGCEPNGNMFKSLKECSQSCSDFICPVCNLPQIKGICKAIIPRWSYNVHTCSCEEFKYGGCGGNGNNFHSLAECQNTCGDYSCPVCNKPAESGLCLAYFPMYFYNINSCQCEEFIYGGCGGNSNRFKRMEDCQQTCDQKQCPVCKLPVKPGPCKGSFPRWFFNTKTCQCTSFIYGGCGGNSNRFETKEECEGSCERSCSPCQQPKKIGPCEALIDRYHFNKETCSCESFKFGGCEENENNFNTIQECKRACSDEDGCNTPKCYLPKDIGPCDNSIKRFYYDPLKCKCRKFQYGGCGGNSNNFLSKGECKKACTKLPCPICNLPLETGSGKDGLLRHFFNITSCQCEKFSFGGRGGNGNNFKSSEDCYSVCGSVECPVCNRRPVKGTCKKKLTRWYFDAEACKCKEFKYGGCGGNLNRFLSRDDCEGSCSAFPCPACSMPLKVGPCRAAINRYYYDAVDSKCKLFSWGGCEPGGNNFLKKKDCKKLCQ